MFNTLYFVNLQVGQVKPKNNLPEAISACLGQALISNPAAHWKKKKKLRHLILLALISPLEIQK